MSNVNTGVAKTRAIELSSARYYDASKHDMYLEQLGVSYRQSKRPT